MSKVIIELKNINKEYDNFKIENLSLNIKKGYITGFIGGNGAGKSTVIKMMLNLVKPDSGEVLLFGKNYHKHEKEIKRKIGFLFDDHLLYDELTLKQVKSLIKPSYTRWNETIFQHYCKQFKLPLNQKIKTYSKGMKMKASLAIALSHGAELLIMDEPTSGLDPMFRKEFLNILQDIMLDEEKTVLLSTHIMTDLSPIADYITFIDDGNILFSKTLIDIEENYSIVRGPKQLLDRDTETLFHCIKREDSRFEALTIQRKKVEEIFSDDVVIEKASLEDVMYFSEGGPIHDPFN